MTGASVPRWGVLAGNGEYEHYEQLPCVESDLNAMADVLNRLGYRYPRRISRCTAQELRAELVDWAAAEGEGRSEGVLVLYYTGHGDRSRDDRHYLLCRDSHPRQLKGSALAAEDIVGIVTETGLRRLLLILDTCYAGQGVADVLRELARSLTATREANQHELTSFSVIAAARPLEEAADGAFAEAFRDAVDDAILGGPRQRRLYVEPVVERINEILASRSTDQHATFGTLSGGDEVPFLPNPRYTPDVPEEGADLAEQQAALSAEGRRRREELLSHFGPRGRGLERATDRGSYFSGRGEALRALMAWLDSRMTAGPQGETLPPSRQIVVTGSPGVGKSALLGRLVLLAPRAVFDDRLPAGHGVDRPVHAAIHARHKLLADIAAAVADAAGLPDTTSPHQLFQALSERLESLVLVIDALDEAGTASGDREAEHIAVTFLAPLAAIPCVRLIVGTRPGVVKALGPQFVPLDLDDPRWGKDEDLADYARQLLRAPDGTGSTSAYPASTASLVAGEIAALADGNYLVARLVARALAHRPVPVDTSFPGWKEGIPRLQRTAPHPTGPAFEWALSDQLGADTERGRSLLRPLALAEGSGLPAAVLWPAIASALTGTRVTADDIRWVMRTAAAYIVEALDDHGRSVYRMYHESFADELRADVTPEHLASVTRALTRLVPPDPATGLPNWSAADPYILNHLATHAAASDLLDDLVCDPVFLINAEPTALQQVLPVVRTGPALAARGAYERVGAEMFREPDRRARLAQLQLAALQSEARDLCNAILHRGEVLPWETQWILPFEDATKQYRTIGSYDGEVTAVTLLEIDGRKVVVTAETPNRVRMWDFETGATLGDLPGAAEHAVRGLVPLPGTGTSLLLVVSCATEDRTHIDGMLRLFDLRDRMPLGPVTPHQAVAWALACIEGRHVVALLEPEAIRLADPATGSELTRIGVREGEFDDLWSRLYRTRGWHLGLGTRAGRLIVTLAGTRPKFHLEVAGPIREWTIDPAAGWRAHPTHHVPRSAGTDVLSVAVRNDRTWVISAGLEAEAKQSRTRDLTDHHPTLTEWTAASRWGWAELVTTPESTVLVYGQEHPAGEIGVIGFDGQQQARVEISGSPGDFVHLQPDAQGYRVLSWKGAGPAPRVWRLEATGTRAHRERTGLWSPSSLSSGKFAGRPVFIVGNSFRDAATGEDLRVPVSDGSPFRHVVGHRDLPPMEYDGLTGMMGDPHVTLLDPAPRDVRLPGARGVLKPQLGRMRGEAVVVARSIDELAAWSMEGQQVGQWPLPVSREVDVQYLDHGDRLLAAVRFNNPDRLTVYSLPERTSGFSMSPLPSLTQEGHHLGLWRDEPAIGLLFDGGVSVFHALTGAPLWRFNDVMPRNQQPILRLLTVHGRPTALVVRADESLSLIDADTDRVTCRIHPGAGVRGVVIANEDLLGVLTATDFVCLRLRDLNRHENPDGF
ncbi:caspase family protein [Streptomyces sp. NPDC097107]|uniref:caspase family protein n=1 Tax=Streptomyces sp. NPDC097107 TaxID=3366089 RepID=UPI0038218D08